MSGSEPTSVAEPSPGSRGTAVSTELGATSEPSKPERPKTEQTTAMGRVTEPTASAQPAKSGTPSASGRVLRLAAHYPLAHPISLAAAIAYFVCAIVPGSFDKLSQDWQFVLGNQLDPFHGWWWWTPFTGSFLTNGWPQAIGFIVASLVLLGISEVLMGWARTLVAFLVTTIMAPIIGSAIIGLVANVFPNWVNSVQEVYSAGSLCGVAGAIMTASAFVGSLWRRRIRLLCAMVVILFVTYSGSASDIYRALGALSGLLLGMAIGPHSSVLGWLRSSASETRRLLAAAAGLLAIGPLISLGSHSRVGPLSTYGLLLAAPSKNPCSGAQVSSRCLADLATAHAIGPWSVVTAVLPMLALLLAAYGILLGRRFALWFAVAIEAMMGLSAAAYFGVGDVVRQLLRADFAHVNHHPGVFLGIILTVLMPLAAAVLLILARGRFPQATDAWRVWRYCVIVAGSLVVLVAAYLVALYIVPSGTFSRVPSLGQALASLPSRFAPDGLLGIRDVGFDPSSRLGRIIWSAPGVLWWLVVIIAAVPSIVLSSRVVDRQNPARMRALVHQGGDTRGAMSLWPGNRWWFSESGTTAIAYRVIGRIVLTNGSPVGVWPPNKEVLMEFAQWCDRMGWTPVLYSFDDALEPLVEEMGWDISVVGEEELIRTADWTLAGKKRQPIRTTVNKAEKSGTEFVWAPWTDLPLTVRVQIEQISEEWVGNKALPEMGFTLGTLEEGKDPDVMLMVALDPEHRVLAFTSWLGMWREGTLEGRTLDLMRRGPDAPNGIMEALIATVAERLKADGVPILSLSATPMAHGDDDSGSALDSLLDSMAARLEPVYGFKSLGRFKKKFLPETHPVLMALPDALALPEAGIAIVRAYLPNMTVGQAAALARELRNNNRNESQKPASVL